MLADQVITSSLTREILRGVLEALGKRHAVGVPELSYELMKQLGGALAGGALAFVGGLAETPKNPQKLKKFLSAYLSAPESVAEISKLLDPGLEIIDKPTLTAFFFQILPEDIDSSFDPETVTAAWDRFLSAFSFRSRQAPELQAFLRASFEAASFREMSDISGLLDQLEQELNQVQTEEDRLTDAIDRYSGDLDGYRRWATSFSA
ncbi:MAG: hypothetical protein HQL52_07035 [Magnetococcales bacterium]|nr:hypothetical protein [Magnetococcales bacterium]